MSETKYGKYILRQTKPAATISPATPIMLEGLKDWGGIQHRMEWKYITQPLLMDKEPHSHDFDEFLCFLGNDPTNACDFKAEVELSLGKEGEKKVITASSIICVPKGLVHGPLNFSRIDKPIWFVNVYLAPEYVKKPLKK
jgi:hypothetical protein